MWEVLSRLSSNDLVAVVIVTIAGGAVLLITLINSISHHWRRHHERQLVTSLILEMLDRGMAVDDIVRVLSAADLQDQQDELFAWQQRLGQRLRQKLAARVSPKSANPAAKT
jgi:hypothetical protein